MGFSVWDIESFINTILFLFLIILMIGILFSVPRVYSVGPSYISPYPVFSGPSVMISHTTTSGPAHAPSAPSAPRAPRFRR